MVFRASSVEVLQNIKGILHILFIAFLILPYYYIDAIISLFVRKEPKSVRGEIVLITGTGHGIGKLLAKKYATEGATVIGWDINEELNSQTIKEIKQLGYPNIHGYKVDVSDRENVVENARKVQEAIGDVTILINNAGIMPAHPFLEHSVKEIEKIMDINVMAHFWTLQAFLPAMKRNNHGHVVALSSMAGLLGLVNLAPYNASKFAVRGLMEGLREEFRRNPNNNVHFTTIYPYMIDTGLCKAVDIAYPGIVPMLKPEFVAEKIFEAQVNNKRNVSLPADIGVLLSIKTTLMPERAAEYISDTFKSDVVAGRGLEPNQANGLQK